MYVYGDVSYNMNRATYCMYVVMLVTVSVRLNNSCMW